MAFMRSACQYYTTARFAMHAKCMSVGGNLFHHAVEMFLKTGLVKKRKSSDLKDIGHDLKKLWRAFKVDFPDAALERHDKTISALKKFEEIRYPGDSGMGMTADWFGPPGKVTTYGGLKTPKQYSLVVSDIDDLIADVIRACSWYPDSFVGTDPAALEAITRHNKHADFLTKRVS
jgi:hypothetical protein